VACAWCCRELDVVGREYLAARERVRGDRRTTDEHRLLRAGDPRRERAHRDDRHQEQRVEYGKGDLLQDRGKHG